MRHQPKTWPLTPSYFSNTQVLDLPVAEDLAPVRSKKPVRLPVILS